MKIGIVGDDTMDKTDGVEQYMLTVGQWLTSKGHEVHYLVGETTRTDLPHLHSLSRNVKVRFNNNRVSVPLPARRSRIRRLLAREQFDVLYVQMPYSPFLAGRIIKAAPKHTAVVGIFHIMPYSWVVSVGTCLLRMLVWRNLRRFDAFLSVSRPAQHFSKRAFKISSRVVPNASPLKPFFNAKPLPAYKDVLTVVFLGRLVERKGCAQLLKAVAYLRATNAWPVNAQVVICGGGPLEAQLKQFVAESELDEIVSFTGFLTEEDKPRYLASADVVAYPSSGGESFGIVLLEAMAASRGVVLAGDNPGYRSVMAPHAASLFDPHDDVALANKLQHFLHDAKARKDARTWQQQYVRQFDITEVGQQLLAVFGEALHKRRP